MGRKPLGQPMIFDYISVLIAAGAAGAALCITLSLNWFRQRSSPFLATWAVSMAIVVAAIAGFAVFESGGGTLSAMVGCLGLSTGFILSYGGLVQFRDGRFPHRGIALAALLAAVPMVAAGALGYSGVMLWMVNSLSAGVLAFIGYAYWRMRAESVATITAIALLHGILAVSFVLCFAVGLMTTSPVLDGMPNNWAEVLNLVCAIIAITGIGGLLVTMHQERIAGAHRVDALTDPLTGLKNRRALFEWFGREDVSESTALLIFDLDDFKKLNDRHGHAFGDMVLARFADLLSANVRGGDIAVRLGGEEFAVVMPRTGEPFAMSAAERIRNAMAETVHRMGGVDVICTVSAGVAVAHKGGISLDTLMRKADNALYLSKRNGRNKVTPLASSAA